MRKAVRWVGITHAWSTQTSNRVTVPYVCARMGAVPKQSTVTKSVTKRVCRLACAKRAYLHEADFRRKIFYTKRRGSTADSC
ncbi:MAG: hypothetical protein IJ520_02630 [Synergistaceae bacterium]|nr:hypothetical protein [Synergistaceae bacterium]